MRANSEDKGEARRSGLNWPRHVGKLSICVDFHVHRHNASVNTELQ